MFALSLGIGIAFAIIGLKVIAKKLKPNTIKKINNLVKKSYIGFFVGAVVPIFATLFFYLSNTLLTYIDCNECFFEGVLWFAVFFFYFPGIIAPETRFLVHIMAISYWGCCGATVSMFLKKYHVATIC